ncbi:tRNA-splicing endonuclease subunit Sen2-1-like isoform X2 [Curcuma longa]|uniref:tRNA-splicing endonuclease subunit Sen2-1-like isoform X2 n=1 Tax=Curcuma longa TaxID=136217 RepID=UPI003D9F1E3B
MEKLCLQESIIEKVNGEASSTAGDNIENENQEAKPKDEMMKLSGPRWKRKGFVDIAHANPMSRIVLQLQTSLKQSKSNATLSGCIVFVKVEPEAGELLEQASFGKIFTSQDDKQHFQFNLEESFYLYHALKCIKIVRDDETPLEELELWKIFTSERKGFPELYKAYSHLRSKNWVVRSGTNYGVDFIAYRHHPALVHAEYAVLVIPEKDSNAKIDRLSSSPGLCCPLRLSGSVAKTLLVLYIMGGCNSNKSSMSCLEEFTVEERVIRRWIPEQSQEGNAYLN